jgi:hypothetical protein
MNDQEYRGEATIRSGNTALPVQVHLGVYFEPIDGRYHWYGRVSPDSEVTALAEDRSTDVVLRTPYGEASARLGDVDPWNRYRLSGVGLPPFPMGIVPDAEPETL